MPIEKSKILEDKKNLVQRIVDIKRLVEVISAIYGTPEKVEPFNALPVRYDPKTNLRISPDIERYCVNGIWYFANNFRDEKRSHKIPYDESKDKLFYIINGERVPAWKVEVNPQKY